MRKGRKSGCIILGGKKEELQSCRAIEKLSYCVAKKLSDVYCIRKSNKCKNEVGSTFIG